MCMASSLPLAETTNLDQYSKNVVLLRQEKPFDYIHSCQRESVFIGSICQNSTPKKHVCISTSDFYPKYASLDLQNITLLKAKLVYCVKKNDNVDTSC